MLEMQGKICLASVVDRCMTKISEQSTTGPYLLSTEEAARKVGVSITTYRSYAKLAGVKPARVVFTQFRYMYHLWTHDNVRAINAFQSARRRPKTL